MEWFWRTFDFDRHPIRLLLLFFTVVALSLVGMGITFGEVAQKERSRRQGICIDVHTHTKYYDYGGERSSKALKFRGMRNER